MDDDPPAEFVEAVAAHERELRHEAVRLAGGDPTGLDIYQDVLADLAGHWRRLRWWARLSRADPTGRYLRRRLARRIRAWRAEQIHEVDVRVLRTPPGTPVAVGGPAASVAFHKAAVLEGTARTALPTLADAAVAWVHAWRRAEHRRIARLVIGSVLLVGGMVQGMSWFAAPD
ncbi:hypothetical protein [Actinoplanes teichomyceticus]|nr:hypothetical protein [Actinoplanes teichomyceticus]GIF13221.1 hypothetical protein Ate01nite_32530 [Actinoplanes teichomyceticus]